MISQRTFLEMLDAAIDDLTRVRQAVPQTWERIRHDSDGKIAAQRFDPTGRSSGGRSPTEDRAQRRRDAELRAASAKKAPPPADPVLEQAARLVAAGRDAAKAARIAYHATAKLLPLPAEAAELMARHEHTASCSNCGRTVAQTASDRLKNSRCAACYQYRLRHGVDRPARQPDTEEGAA